MKNLEDKLAASIKPARPKSSPKTKSPAADVSKAAGEQNPGQVPASAPSEQQRAEEKKRPAPRQQAKEKPGAAAPDLNGQAQPLHPKRVWPD